MFKEHLKNIFFVCECQANINPQNSINLASITFTLCCESEIITNSTGWIVCEKGRKKNTQCHTLYEVQLRHKLAPIITSNRTIRTFNGFAEEYQSIHWPNCTVVPCCEDSWNKTPFTSFIFRGYKQIWCKPREYNKRWRRLISFALLLIIYHIPSSNIQRKYVNKSEWYKHYYIFQYTAGNWVSLWFQNSFQKKSCLVICAGTSNTVALHAISFNCVAENRFELWSITRDRHSVGDWLNVDVIWLIMRK